ncbi:MAG: hypothetical protein AAB897_03990 [Patescibacteria group bacterium]
MSDWEKCPELARLPDLLESNKPLPRNYLRHAGVCEICFFWTSWSLAIHKALANVDKMFYPECPTRSQFEMLLFGTIYGLRKPGVGRMDRNIFHVSDIRLHDAIAHFNRDNADHCDVCFTYYNALYEKMVECQQEFAELLSAGKPIDYPVEEITQTFDALKIDYDPKKKPN